MAISTFHGLEVAKRGMMTHQAALYTTGHNIANANTPGYTRQRVNFIQTEPYPPASLNRPMIPGQLGTGVKAGDIQRIRDSFVDMQFRGENSKLGYWEAKADMLRQMENIMNEPTDTGLANIMDEFWNSLQDLAVQPQNNGARRVVSQRGIELANTFNYTYNSIKAVQKDYRNEIDLSQDRINSILRQINQVNKEIGSIEPHGYLPNDLYDQRDRLVDELSSYINIKVERKPSGGLASGNAEGLYNIYLANPQGGILTSNGEKIKLIEAMDDSGAYKHTATGIHIEYAARDEEDSPVTAIKFFELNPNGKGFVDPTDSSKTIDKLDDADAATGKYEFASFSAFNTHGRLKGFIEGYGYKDENGVTKGSYNQMLDDLDMMAYTFATHFNLVHRSGYSLTDIRGEKIPRDFFELKDDAGNDIKDPKGAAKYLKVSKDIIENVDNIAAAAEGNVYAGSFKRDSNVQNTTVGNPVFRGIYDSKNGTAAEVMPNNPADPTKQFKIELTYKEPTTPNTKGTWTYTVTATTQGGQPVNNIPNDTGPVPPNGKITLYGIEIDTNLVKSKDDTSNPVTAQTWEYTFSTDGIQSKDDAFLGNGSNALVLSRVKDALLNYGGSMTNVHSFYQGMIGSLGDMTSEANRMTSTSTILKDSVEQRRMSISSVSLDEEITNMIQFQYAYNASARMITLVDEILDKIINGMGLVGR